jgi:voltage-gated potassium channel
LARRFGIAVALLVTVFLYGALGHYLLLYPHETLLNCAFRTIVLLGTINEAFSPAELGEFYTPTYVAFMLSMVVFGISVILYALSTITAFLVEGDLQHLWRLRKMNKEIKAMNGHFIIVGAGETGHYIAEELKVSRHRQVIIEVDPERAERMQAQGYLCMQGDASEEGVLEEAGIMRAKGLAVALPTDKDNLFVTITARQMNPGLTIISKGVDETVEKKLSAAGADKIVRPAFIGGMRMASELIRPMAVTFMDKMLRDPDQHTRIEEIVINDGSALGGQTIATSQFRQKTGLQVVAIRRPGETLFDYNPRADEPLQHDTVLVVLGRTEDAAKARAMAGMV